MAAWTAKVAGIFAGGDNASFVVSVNYYLATDSTFTTILATKQLQLPANSTLADAAAMVVAAGQVARTVTNQVTALQTQVGTTINVP